MRGSAHGTLQTDTEDVTISSSATGMGTHIRWITHPISSSAVPHLSFHDDSDSDDSSPPGPITPEHNNIGSVYIANGSFRSPASSREEEITRRYVVQLQNDKELAEASLKESPDESECSDEEMAETYATDAEGRRLPEGIKGLGPEGTFLTSDGWSPPVLETDPATTNQLPSINEDVEYMDMDQDNDQILPPQPEFVQGSSHDHDSPTAAEAVNAGFGGLPEFVSTFGEVSPFFHA